MRISSPPFTKAFVALAALLYVGLLPLMPAGASGNWHDMARLMQTPLLLLGAISLSGRLQFRIHPRTNPASALGCGLLFCLAVLSCIYAEVPYMAWRELAEAVGMISLGIAIATGSGGMREKAMIGRGVILAAAAYGACFLLELALALSSRLSLDNSRVIFGYDNPRFLNHAQTVMLPLLIVTLAIDGLGARWRAMAWFAMTCQFALLALTLGRSTALSLVGLGSVALLIYGQAGRTFALRLAMGGLSGAILFSFFRLLAKALDVPVADTLNASSGLESDHSRLYLWRIAEGFIAESPWLGIGPMNFAHHPNHGGAHPHNVYLQVAAEFGLPAALLIFSAAFYQLARRGLALRLAVQSRQHHPLVLGAFFACVGAAIDGMFSGNFVMPISQVWIALAIGLLFSDSSDQSESAAPSRTTSLVGLLVVALIASQLWLAVVTFVEWQERYPHPTQHGEHAAVTVDGPQRPRFWLNGWF